MVSNDVSLLLCGNIQRHLDLLSGSLRNLSRILYGEFVEYLKNIQGLFKFSARVIISKYYKQSEPV